LISFNKLIGLFFCKYAKTAVPHQLMDTRSRLVANSQSPEH